MLLPPLLSVVKLCRLVQFKMAIASERLAAASKRLHLVSRLGLEAASNFQVLLQHFHRFHSAEFESKGFNGI